MQVHHQECCKQEGCKRVCEPPHPNVQLYSLTLVELLSKNHGELHSEITLRAFTQSRERLITVIHRSCVQSLGSPLHRGANTVSQGVLGCRGDRREGCAAWYSELVGRCEVEVRWELGDVLVRRVKCIPVGDLRTCLRCERVGVSRLENLNHLFEGEKGKGEE